MLPKLRSAIRAVASPCILSFFVPGLGHFYLGYGIRGICIWMAYQLLPLVLGLTPLVYSLTGYYTLVGLKGGIFLICIADSASLAIRNSAQTRPRTWSVTRLLPYLAAFFVTVVVSIAVPMPVQLYAVTRQSLSPDVMAGDYVVAVNTAYRDIGWGPGDLAFFVRPNDDYIDVGYLEAGPRQRISTESVASDSVRSFLSAVCTSNTYSSQQIEALKLEMNGAGNVIVIPEGVVAISMERPKKEKPSRLIFVDEKCLVGKGLYVGWSLTFNRIGQPVISTSER